MTKFILGIHCFKFNGYFIYHIEKLTFLFNLLFLIFPRSTMIMACNLVSRVRVFSFLFIRDMEDCMLSLYILFCTSKGFPIEEKNVEFNQITLTIVALQTKWFVIEYANFSSVDKCLKYSYLRHFIFLVDKFSNSKKNLICRCFLPT